MNTDPKPRRKPSPKGLGGVYERNGLWYMRFTYRGCDYRESSGSRRKRVAIALLKKRIAEVQDGAFAPAGANTKLRDLLALTEADYRANGLRTVDRLRTLHGHLTRILGADTPAEQIPDMLGRYVRTRLEEKIGDAKEGEEQRTTHPSTVNRELSALRRGFRLARRARLLTVVPDFELLEEHNVRTGFPTPEEVDAIVEAIGEPLKPVVRFLSMTGWRLGEVLNLQWRNVDRKAGVLRLERGETKGGEVRILPYRENPALEALLEERHAATMAWAEEHGAIVPWVFWQPGADEKGEPAAVPNRLQRTSKLFRDAAAAAGCAHVTAHDLRRYVARNLVRAGVHEKVAMALLGHRTRSIFDRYNITDDRDLRAAVRKLATTAQERDAAPTTREA